MRQFFNVLEHCVDVHVVEYYEVYILISIMNEIFFIVNSRVDMRREREKQR